MLSVRNWLENTLAFFKSIFVRRRMQGFVVEMRGKEALCHVIDLKTHEIFEEIYDESVFVDENYINNCFCRKGACFEMETFGKPLTLRQISCSELEDKFFSRSWSALNTMGGQIKL